MYNQIAPTKVSISAIRPTMKANGMQNYTAASKPYLSPKNMKARFEWTTVQENWDEDQWDRVVFNDESSFAMRRTSLKKKIWRKSDTKFELRNLVPTFKSGYLAISVCSAFSAQGRTPLVRIDGTLKQGSYNEILDNYVLAFAVENMEALLTLFFSKPTVDHIRLSLSLLL